MLPTSFLLSVSMLLVKKHWAKFHKYESKSEVVEYKTKSDVIITTSLNAEMIWQLRM